MSANKSVYRMKIGPLQLAMITVAYVASVRSMPTIAEYGFSCMFYYIVAALTFLIPSALVSAELATAWPERGGIYAWVKKSLGARWGFLAIWLQFLSNVVGLPALLSFLAATTAYVFMPQLAYNKYFLIGFILVVFWGSTFVSFFGMKTAGWLNSIGAIAGTLIPAAVVIVLGIVWLVLGRHTQIVMTWQTFVPDFGRLRINDLVFLAGLMYGLTGMEVSGAHALDVDNARTNYPKGIFLAVLLVSFVGFGALSIAMVVPQQQLSLVSGVMQAFTVFFDQFHLSWAVPVLAAAIVIGLTGCLNSSVIGPSKGLYGTAEGGDIPPILTKLNKYGMPSNMFIFQAIVVSLMSLLFLYMPSASSTYWLIMSIVSILYLLMYILLFISGIVSRYRHPDVERSYKIPGGKLGMWIVAGLGLLSTSFVTILAFFPPAQLLVGDVYIYELFLGCGVVGFILVGMIMFGLRKPHWAIKMDI